MCRGSDPPERSRSLGRGIVVSAVVFAGVCGGLLLLVRALSPTPNFVTPASRLARPVSFTYATPGYPAQVRFESFPDSGAVCIGSGPVPTAQTVLDATEEVCLSYGRFKELLRTGH